jgi:peroxin-6
MALDPSIVNTLKECISKSALSWKITGFPVLVVATTADSSFVPLSILSCFKNEILFEVSIRPVIF